MDASLMKASALWLRFSPSLASRRQRLSVNAGVNWGHGAGVRRDHLLMPDTVLPVVPGVHWRDPRCFV